MFFCMRVVVLSVLFFHGVLFYNCVFCYIYIYTHTFSCYHSFFRFRCAFLSQPLGAVDRMMQATNLCVTVCHCSVDLIMSYLI